MRPGFGPARLRVRAPALPWPLFDRPSPRPAPSRLAWPPPGEGAPPRSRSREGSPFAAAEPGNLRAGKSLRRLRGAARRGAARPWRSRSQPVTFWTSRQSGPRRSRRRLRGGPESVRGRPRPGLRPWRVAAEERKTTQEEISHSGHREGISKMVLGNSKRGFNSATGK
ncbi:putative uncharacterized protein encoded by LINC00472 isoform X2 [Lutra lutra]|uniref:putative uncharacterized protein encoded by LINC00472 isoform X2 n=1 Tax=Lutra lutra TaxID=9657 RepID=UPI001FD41A6E|nr:putative uncharacterized protein encoded by LINC00472 isoform X2 [Lutra lutra]